MSRSRIDKLDQSFTELHRRRCELARTAGDGVIYSGLNDSDRTLAPKTIGTYLIRSAAVVEQMINGITVRLWDDPFEWTLPERLPTVDDLVAYFDEVETARIRGFLFLRTDAELRRSIPAPIELNTLEQILTGTLTASKTFLSEAMSTLSDGTPPSRHGNK